MQQACYDLLVQVPKGKVTTYKDLANAMGTRAYRLVGRYMNKNPHLVELPCHRVVNANGNIGGYVGGIDKKIALLKKEGIKVKDEKIVDFESKRFNFFD